MKQIDQLTSLRGLAAWWVVLFHFRDALGLANSSLVYRFMSMGYLAVDFFFILSGFIIYLNYHNSFNRINAASLKSFYVRRLARIYPLHLFMLLLFLINPLAIILFSQNGNLGNQYDPIYYIASLLLVQNWGMFDSLKWNIPAWSISTEFAAYLLFPLIALILRRIMHSMLMHSVILALLLLMIPWIFTRVNGMSLGHEIPSIGILRCIIEFSIGTVLGSIFSNHQSYVLQKKGVISAIGILILAFVVFSEIRDYYLAPIFFTIVVIWLSLDKSIISHLLKYKTLIFLGDISYSTYLGHYFVRDWVKFLSDDVGPKQFAIYLVFVLLSSIVLYRYIEMPGRRWVQQRFLNDKQSKNSLGKKND